MKRILLVVEGQTEEAFVNQILVPALAVHQVYTSATRIITSQTVHRTYKGGFVNFEHLARDVSRFLKADTRRYVGCMVDLYRLPSSVPGYEFAQSRADAYQKVEALHTAWSGHFDSERFVPFVQLHEFEALLYADPDAAKTVTGGTNVTAAMKVALAEANGNPELVNQTPEGAPSKRLMTAFPRYQKVLHGVQIAQHVGLEKMLAQCAHFKAWYDTLLALPSLP